MNDVSPLLERMADRSDGFDLPEPAAVRRLGERRTRRRVAWAGATALAVAATLAVALGDGSPNRAPQPARPPFVPVRPQQVAPLGPGLLTYVAGRRIEIGVAHASPVDLSINDAVCHGCGVAGLSWSPDGNTLGLLTVQASGGGPGQTRQSIFMVRRSSGATRRVVDCVGPGTSGYSNCGFAQGAFAWSPDSASLAYASGGHIFTVRARPPLAPPVDVCPACDTGALDWSPDGRTIAFLGGPGIEVVSATGGAPVSVATIAEPSDVSWSPDGARLAVEAPDGIHVVDLRTAKPTAVLAVPQRPSEGPGAPVWSPDGKRIAFFSTPTVGGKRFEAQLGIVRPDGTHRRILTDFGCCTSDWSPPEWSPDGTRIALSLGLVATEPPKVLVVNAVTGSVVRRETGGGPVSWRRVSPESRGHR